MKLHEAERLFNNLKKENPEKTYVVKMTRNGKCTVEIKDSELDRLHDLTPEQSNMKITDFIDEKERGNQ